MIFLHIGFLTINAASAGIAAYRLDHEPAPPKYMPLVLIGSVMCWIVSAILIASDLS